MIDKPWFLRCNLFIYERCSSLHEHYSCSKAWYMSAFHLYMNIIHVPMAIFLYLYGHIPIQEPRAESQGPQSTAHRPRPMFHVKHPRFLPQSRLVKNSKNQNPQPTDRGTLFTGDGLNCVRHKYFSRKKLRSVVRQPLLFNRDYSP